MSIIIRLQNLPLSAKASDIRDFFSNLKIPKGAVNIVGGIEGDAFIGFATDEDARLAMRFEGKLLHNAKVKLLLSSKTEMDSVISSAHAMAKAESFSGAAAQSSNSPIASQTKPFADVPSEGLKKDVKVPPFNFGPAVAQISGQSVHQNNSSNGEFGNGNSWNYAPVVTQLPSDSWKTSTSAYTAFQPPFQAPVSSTPIQQTTEAPKLLYSNPMDPSPLGGAMYQQQQQQPANNRFPVPNSFAPPGNNLQPPPFSATTNNPPFSPPFVQLNPYSDGRDEARAHSYQQHFDSPGTRQTGLPAFAPSQYPPPQQQQPRNGSAGNLSLGNTAPAKEQPPPFQQQPQQHTYGQQLAYESQHQPPAKPGNNAPWIYPPPNHTYPNTVQDQNHFRNMGNDSGQMGYGTTNKPPLSPSNVYVELSRLPNELLRPANLEAFLSPTIPLTLSSVKVMYNNDGSVMHALVKFGSEEDAKRIVHRNGDRGVKIIPSSETIFNNAIDGILGAVAKPIVGNTDNDRPMMNNNAKRSPPPAFPHNQYANNDHQAKRRREGGVWQSGNDNDFDHRHRNADIKERGDRPAFNPAIRGNQQYTNKKERICVQLTNVPYKATYDNIRDLVCSNKGGRYEKITRTYYAGKNLSDRWIVEFSNERDASSVYKSRAEILGRRIHCEYVNPRAADEQYVIPEPEEKRDRGQQRSAPFQPQRGPPPSANVPQHRKRDSHPDIPNMTLEASTLDELITRGDLPPTSFGAFQSAVAPSTGVLRKTGFTRKLGVGNPFNNGVGNNNNNPPPHHNIFNAQLGNNNLPPNNSSFSPQPNNNPAARSADHQNNFSQGPAHQPFVPPSNNFSRTGPAAPWPAASQETNRRNPPRDPKFRPLVQTLDPATKSSGLLPHPPPNIEEDPVPLFSIKFQNGSENGDPRRQPSMDLTLNSTCDTENGRLMIAEPDSSVMSSASCSGLSIAPSAASSSIEKMSPFASFLELTRENGEARTAVRLENVQKMVIAEKLCQFLGVQLVSPSENIARMPDGSLYVNLSNEEWASKAAGRNGAFLERNKIFIQQISRNAMAEAIRHNLFNAPKPSEHALVARGFNKGTTVNHVAAFFEKFHPLTVSLLAEADDSACFVITFTDAQECGAALMILNNTKLANRVISLQMGPVVHVNQ